MRILWYLLCGDKVIDTGVKLTKTISQIVVHHKANNVCSYMIIIMTEKFSLSVLSKLKLLYEIEHLSVYYLFHNSCSKTNCYVIHICNCLKYNHLNYIRELKKRDEPERLIQIHYTTQYNMSITLHAICT